MVGPGGLGVVALKTPVFHPHLTNQGGSMSVFFFFFFFKALAFELKYK